MLTGAPTCNRANSISTASVSNQTLQVSFISLLTTMLHWQPPRGLPLYTAIPTWLLNWLNDNHGLSRCINGRNLSGVPLDQWPLGGVSALLRADTEDLLQVDCDYNDVFVARSTIEGAGRGVFAARDFAIGDRILPMTGQIVYDDLTAALTSADPSLAIRRYAAASRVHCFSSTPLYWARFSVQLETRFPFWGSRSGPRFYDAAGASRPIWIVPARFCAAGVVNDPRHVRSDGSVSSAESVGRAVNTVFDTVHPLIDDTSLLVGPGPVYLRVTKPIMEGEEFFVDYGSEYAFWW